MTTTINASTSSGLVVTPDNSGNVLLQYNGQSAPAFSVYLAANQSIGSATWTKVTFDTEEFDTNSNFASNRFTPTVAGYYQVNLMVYISAAGSSQGNAAIYKNGVITKANYLTVTSAQVLPVSAIIYMNGTTDYLEAYAYSAGAGVVAGGAGNAPYCYFQACLLRGA